MSEDNDAVPSIENAEWMRIETTGHMPYDRTRFLVMQGTGRVWACDGEYVACRPKKFHEGTVARHQRFLASGFYEHVGTFDDVQVFKLLPGSPFRRDTTTFLPDLNMSQVIREAAKACQTHNWTLFVDILEEISSRLKSNLHEGQAKLVYEETLQHIFQNASWRGVTQPIIDAGVADVRRRRGAAGRRIALPAASRIALH